MLVFAHRDINNTVRQILVVMSHIIFYAVKTLTRLGAKRNLLEEKTMIPLTDNIENYEKKIQN